MTLKSPETPSPGRNPAKNRSTQTLFEVEQLRKLDSHLARVRQGIISSGQTLLIRNDSGDTADDANMNTAIFEAGAQIENSSRVERDIVEAIYRIRTGGYGVCTHCETDIPKARLKTMPHALHCVDCQGKIDRGVLRRNGNIGADGWDTVTDVGNEDKPLTQPEADDVYIPGID